MAHTVIWMATVYFTAFVGCAFSSPRYNANATVDDAAQSSTDAETTDGTTGITTNATVQNNYATSDQQNATSADSLDHDRGGPGTETNNQSSASIITDENNNGRMATAVDKNLGLNASKPTEEHDDMSNLDQYDDSCPNCKPWKQFKQELEERHVATIKEYLLAKLRMDSPPVLKAPVPTLPLMELQRDYMYLKDEPRYRNRRVYAKNFFAKTVQVFVMGKDETHRCIHRKSAGCYYFDVLGKVSPYDVATAELWVYKLFNHNDPYIQTFFFHELERSNRSNKGKPRNMRRIETKMKYGWLKIDVKKTVLRWLHKPHKNAGVSIVCKGCQRKDYRQIFSTKNDTMPFIVIRTKKGRRHRRLGRSVPRECTETSTECCLAPLEVDFNAIGWSGVVAPKTLRANYCTGSCHAAYQSHGNHSQLIQDHRWSRASPQQRREMTPCCSPISYAHQSLMYEDDNGGYRTVLVPNLQATACGCL